MVLDEQRIASVDLIEISSSYPRKVGCNARLGTHGASWTDPAVIVRTTKGAFGWGLLAWNAASLDGFLARQLGDIYDPKTGLIDDAPLSDFHRVARELAERLVRHGQELVGVRLADLFDPGVGVIDDAARPFDFALHDLAGHFLSVPVYELLGAAGERSVPCYDGAIYFDDLDPREDPLGIEAVLQNCAADHALGYRDFKLKIGRGHRWMSPDAGLRRDIQVTRAVRSAYPECRLLIDANNGYCCQTFLEYLEAVADCDLFWIEEPFPESDDGFRALRAFLQRVGSEHTLIAEGEGDEHRDRTALSLAENGLIDVVIFDVVEYGLTSWRALMPRLIELGVRASPHTWGSPLKTLYAAQLAAGLGNVVAVEGVPGRSRGVDGGAYVINDGVLSVPDLPGFGMALSSAPAS